MNCEFCDMRNMPEDQYVDHVYRDHIHGGFAKDVTLYAIIKALANAKRELELCRNGVISKK